MAMLTNFVKLIKKVLSEVTQTPAFKEKILTDTKKKQNSAQNVGRSLDCEKQSVKMSKHDFARKKLQKFGTYDHSIAKNYYHRKKSLKGKTPFMSR